MTLIPSEQDLRGLYEKAPQNVRDFVVSAELLDAFDVIRTEHKLHLDEAGKLTDALVAVFLEAKPASDFPLMLKEALEQNASAYDAVLKAVNEKIFTAFRNTLKPATETQPQSAPVQSVVPPPSSAPLIKTPMDRLKETSNAGAQTVQAPPPIENIPREASPQPLATTYKSTDPYREPIE